MFNELWEPLRMGFGTWVPLNARAHTGSTQFRHTISGRREYTASVSFHTFRRARHGRRFLCRKTYILQTGYDATSVGSVASIRGVVRKQD